MISKSASFTLPVHQLVIFVKEAVEFDRSVGLLVQVCMLLEDVPLELRYNDDILTLSEIVGKPISLDVDSLAQRGWLCGSVTRPLFVDLWSFFPLLRHTVSRSGSGSRGVRKLCSTSSPRLRPRMARLMIVPMTVFRAALPSLPESGRLCGHIYTISTPKGFVEGGQQRK